MKKTSRAIFMLFLILPSAFVMFNAKAKANVASLPASSQPILFFDDFSDRTFTETHWTPLGPGYWWVHVDGVYTVYLDGFGTALSQVTGSEQWTDYILEVTGVSEFDERRPGCDERYFCRLSNDGKNGYYFALRYGWAVGDESPRWFFIGMKDGNEETLWSGPLDAYNVVNHNWHDVTIEAIGDKFALWVDSALIAEVSDQEHEKGGIGLGGEGYGLPFGYYFDNVKVWSVAITWASTASLPGPRAQHASVAYNGRIYVLGGWEGAGDDTVYYCNVNPDGTIDSWHSTTPLPERRSETVAVAYNGYIYLLGGQGPQPPYRIERDTVWYAPINPDGTLGSWGTTTSLPESQSGHGAFAWNGRIYVVGGWTGFSFRTETYFAEIHADGTLGTWTSTSSLPEGRGHGIAAIAHNSFAYALGGQGPNLKYKTDVWFARIKSDGTLDSWAPTTSMLMGLHGHGVAIVNNEIYVIGGYADVPLTERSEVYRATINSDGTLEDWIRDTDLALPLGIEPRGHLLQAPVCNNRIYVIGGTDKTGPTDTVYYTHLLAAQVPVAVLSASPTNVDIGEDVIFDASASYDSDGDVEYYWFDYGDGSNSGWISPSISVHSYEKSSIYNAKVKVKDNDGLESEWSKLVKITATHLQLIRGYFPHWKFSLGEIFYPCSFYFDDGDVTNNQFSALSGHYSDYRHEHGGEYPPYYVYIHEVEDDTYFTLQYWLYYAYNDKVAYFSLPPSPGNPPIPGPIPIPFFHQHDWDSTIFIVFDKSDYSNPAEVRFASHDNIIVRQWNDVEKEDMNHVVGYVAMQSHAIYPDLLSLYLSRFDYWIPGGRTATSDDFSWVVVFGNPTYTSEPPDHEWSNIDYETISLPDSGKGLQHPIFNEALWPNRFLPIGKHTFGSADPAPWQRLSDNTYGLWDKPGIWDQTRPDLGTPIIIMGVCSPADIHIYDLFGRHVGKNYETGEIETQIPNAVYEILPDSQYILIEVPMEGDYDVHLVGTADGTYTFYCISVANGIIAGFEADAGRILTGETLYYTMCMSEAGEIKPISWEYVFEDTRRGTMLKTSTDDKYFQFIAPDKDFGIKQDLKMKVFDHVIAICYTDSQMSLLAAADGNVGFCSAVAWDKQTRKTYWLIEYPPTYTLTVCCIDANGKAVCGAGVYVNGCYRGQTGPNGELIINDVLAGTYTVTVKKCGYKDSSGTITITGDVTLTRTLAPQTYTLTVCCRDSKGRAVSGASVSLNGSYQGATDSTGKLIITNIAGGTYALTIKKSGYKDSSITVTVASDKTITVTMK